ncbi:MAG: molybdopterin-dependent oxidoreductase [bacterium]
MTSENMFLKEHQLMSRRYFQRLGLSLAGYGIFQNEKIQAAQSRKAISPDPRKAGAIADPYFTPPGAFQDVSRGNPVPHKLPREKWAEAGLTRDSWRLEVISDPENPARLLNERSLAKQNAIDFAELMKIAETKAVKFAKVMTCLNMGCPLGMGLWEGVPLREIVWMTRPRENLRRVFFHGFHNNDAKQLFQSSLQIGRVLEDPAGLPPVILCYKLNGQWLDIVRGGPVRMVVPEAYGFKSIKWLNQIVLTNLPHANDTYANQNNDIDSPLKTFAASLQVPVEMKSGEMIPVSGYAQVGVSGLKKVQVAIDPADRKWPDDDPYFTSASWLDAEILPPPEKWNVLETDVPLSSTFGFSAQGRPLMWPMKLTNAHWAAVIPPQKPGEYHFRCRTIDENDHAQPMPRPFRKSGHAAIETLSIRIVA